VELRKQTNRVIFHHSLTDAGSVEIFRKHHVEVNGWEDIGYHFVIPKQGRFQKGRDVKYVGSHAKGKNLDSIGICLVGDFFKYEPNQNQIEEALTLYHELCRLYSKNLVIEFHRSINEWNACPGPMLDRHDFLEIVYRGKI
jgi:hypothetical protein